MIHGHTKVAAVPIDGFKQSTSPEGSITGKVRIIRQNPNYYYTLAGATISCLDLIWDGHKTDLAMNIIEDVRQQLNPVNLP